MASVYCKRCNSPIEYIPSPGGGYVSCQFCKGVTPTPPGTPPIPTGRARSGLGASRSPAPSAPPPPPAPPRIRSAASPPSASRPPIPARSTNVSTNARPDGGGSLGTLIGKGVIGAFTVLIVTGAVRGVTSGNPSTRSLPPAGTAAPRGAADHGPRSSGSGINERALAIKGNEAFAAWLQTPIQELERPTPDMRPLPHASWEDHTCRLTEDREFIRPEVSPDRFTVRVSIDVALADAIERQFGEPSLRAPKCYFIEGDGSSEALDRMGAAKRDGIAAAHGISVEHSPSTYTCSPNYDWICRHSLESCRPIARAIVIAVTGREPQDASRREVVEALTSYVQNALRYDEDVKGEQEQRYGNEQYRHDLRTPLAVLLRGGDCDSKSLLLLTLIRSIDPDIALAMVHVSAKSDRTAEYEPHSIAGVGLLPRAGETHRELGGHDLVMIESTAGAYDAEHPLDNDVGHLKDIRWSDLRFDLLP